MYRILIILALFFTSCELSDQRKEREVNSDMIHVPVGEDGEIPSDVPAFEFENKVFEFGTISQGEKVSHSFKFKNTGESDLVIVTIEGSCGCTVLKGWPKHPIAPGEIGKIDVIFESIGKKGKQNKTISVVANTYPSTTVLTLKGEVVAPEAN